MIRIEKDVLGEVKIDDSLYYGVNTYRARENFKITGLTADFDHIWSIVALKRSAAIANNKGGRLDREKMDLIVKACDILMNGKRDFPCGQGNIHKENGDRKRYPGRSGTDAKIRS